jgi:hypothetical protein
VVIGKKQENTLIFENVILPFSLSKPQRNGEFFIKILFVVYLYSYGLLTNSKGDEIKR